MNSYFMTAMSSFKSLYHILNNVLVIKYLTNSARGTCLNSKKSQIARDSSDRLRTVGIAQFGRKARVYPREVAAALNGPRWTVAVLRPSLRWCGNGCEKTTRVRWWWLCLAPQSQPRWREWCGCWIAQVKRRNATPRRAYERERREKVIDVVAVGRFD